MTPSVDDIRQAAEQLDDGTPFGLTMSSWLRRIANGSGTEDLADRTVWACVLPDLHGAMSHEDLAMHVLRELLRNVPEAGAIRVLDYWRSRVQAEDITSRASRALAAYDGASDPRGAPRA